jgi:transcriptional regulator with XRE-family HTH domain
MAKTVYTWEGIQKLAEIIRAARGHLSGRAFAKKVGLSPTSIDRILGGEVKEPELKTLEKLAPHLGYTRDELIAICIGDNSPQPVREYRLAEDLIPMIDQLPDREAAKVAQHIIARLTQPKVSLNGIKGEGVSFHLELMSQTDLADLLRAIATRVEKE